MQGTSTNVASAAAAAISAAVEGSPRTAEAVAQAGGLDLLLSVMKKGSARCKTSAVEALQVTWRSSFTALLQQRRTVHCTIAGVSAVLRTFEIVSAQCWLLLCLEEILH